LALAFPAQAATIRVPDDHPTIQAAIDASSTGDTIEVACGTYYEHDILLKSGTTLRSGTGSPGCVTVDAQGLGSVLRGDLLSQDTNVVGLTLTGGNATGPNPWVWGGGLRLHMASPSVIDCIFESNLADVGGGTAVMHSSSPHFEGCIFRRNSATIQAREIYVLNNSKPVFFECVVVGGEVRSADIGANPTFRQCTLAGTYVFTGPDGQITLERTIASGGNGCNSY
jgi:hypothetical protein